MAPDHRSPRVRLEVIETQHGQERVFFKGPAGIVRAHEKFCAETLAWQRQRQSPGLQTQKHPHTALRTAFPRAVSKKHPLFHCGKQASEFGWAPSQYDSNDQPELYMYLGYVLCTPYNECLRLRNPSQSDSRVAGRAVSNWTLPPLRR